MKKIKNWVVSRNEKCFPNTMKLLTINSKYIKKPERINQTIFSGQKRFKIGQDGSIDTTMVDIRRQIKADMAANSISLKTDLKIGTDYYTSEEVKGFKKRKRKVKKTRVKGGMVLVDDTLARRDFENPIGEKGIVKWSASSRWPFGPNPAWGGIEAIIGNTHPLV